MNKNYPYFFGAGVLLTLLSAVFGMNTKISRAVSFRHLFTDTIPADSAKKVEPAKPDLVLPYPFHDKKPYEPASSQSESPFYLADPANVKSNVDYDPETGNYFINERIGNDFYRNSEYMSFDEYLENENKKSTENYWKQRTHEDVVVQKKSLIPKLHIPSQLFKGIFGSDVIDIKPQGSAELIFAWNQSRNENPNLPEKQRSIGTFDFKEKIQMNVAGNIGEKLKLLTNYNTEALFDFENRMKLGYTGGEDDIVKKIEAGNVSLPLNGTLITGSQSLFGVKTALQFGRLTMTGIFSQQRGKTSTVEVQGGAQTSTFEIKADQYEANKHYFLSEYFKDHYDNALAKLPIISSSVNISKIEVWVTNRTGTTDNTRNILAFMDLGEDTANTYNKFFNQTFGPVPYFPMNRANNLYQMINLDPQFLAVRDRQNVNKTLSGYCKPGAGVRICATRDYESLENAKKLSPTEFTVNKQLGYISLNQTLASDAVLAVAFQYVVGDSTYQVGEFSTDGINAPKNLFVKLLKSSNVSTQLPNWDLMMKNVYSIGAYQVNQKDFILDVLYLNDATGSNINFIPEGGPSIKSIPLLRVLNLDRLNSKLDPQPDGIFDFKEGITINSTNGRIYFPVREPFGSYLRSKFAPGDPLANKYAFTQLYDSTRSAAQQFPERNKYSLKGSYKAASGAEISLNAVNIPQGAVTVTAGGIKLTENVDYTVDYSLGRVKIINEGISNSGTPIKINVESNSLFSIQQKTMIGARFDYLISKDFTVGATLLTLSERPLTQKINIGDEPISNLIYGFDGTYKTTSRFITKMIDRLPFMDTKEQSSVLVSGEFAQLVPGHSSIIGRDGGTSYIDDFEGTRSPIDIKSFSSWSLASTPQQQPALFPEGFQTDLSYGFNRSKLAWYVVDPLFTRQSSLTPSNITKDMQSNHFAREVPEQEIFPNRSQSIQGQTTSISLLNLAFYPSERGPYNYGIVPNSLARGLNPDGSLKDPTTRWGGIMRRIETNDFEAANIESMEFWMLDPFHYDPSANGGDLYFNLGNISEDVCRDGYKAFENGLPTKDVAIPGFAGDTLSGWGRVPVDQAIVNAFDNAAGSRVFQDVGLDGLNDANERLFFKKMYIDSVLNIFGSASGAYKAASNDPSADDYHYFRGDGNDSINNLNILQRYKRYNCQEGNSAESTGSTPTSSTNTPDGEDINRDNTLNEAESYFQYKVSLRPSDMVVGKNFITNVVNASTTLANGTPDQVKWYQFKIPLRGNDMKVIGNIEDFRSIRFVRMFLKGFDKPVICRFARLELVRTDWRKYLMDLRYRSEYIPLENNTAFDISAVNLEDNGSKYPIPYVLPPGIDRVIDPSNPALRKLNEQSLQLRVCDLQDGDSRACYKNASLDVRQYKRLRMFVHEEAGNSAEPLRTGDLTVFIRLGSDLTGNYYEYEVPLTPTPWGASDPNQIWNAANEINLEFAKLESAKQKRNGQHIKLTEIYEVADGNCKISIYGNPNIANIKSIMIGIRNPKRIGGSSDDGFAKCAEVWVNELRLTDFDESGGWAANARITTKLADLGTLNLSGGRKTFGFGGIEQKLNERSRSNTNQYDLATNLEMGKFFPEKSGLKIPMYFAYGETVSNPQYNPLDPDILFSDVINNAELTQKERDSIKFISQDYTLRKSINFTNIQKVKGVGGKSHFYDIENFNFTYAFSEVFHRNISLEHDLSKTYKGAIGYTYTMQPKSFSPFSKIAWKSKYFKPIKDLNINFVPTNFTFRTDLDRFYSENLVRNTTGFSAAIPENFSKSFTMTRMYDFKYDLTKSIKIDFTALNNSIIDEPFGRISTKEQQDTIYNNLYRVRVGGRTAKYHQGATINYTLPLNKLPITDWITASLRYGAEYDWNTASMVAPELGNTIQNSQTIQYTGQFNMTTLYNKVPFLKKLNSNTPPPPPKPKGFKIVMPTNPIFKQAYIDSVRKAKKNQINPVVAAISKVIISMKTVSFTYNETNGMALPGYKPKTQFFGMDKGFGAPGIPFVFGSQADIRPIAGANGWITRDTSMNNPFMKTHTQTFTARTSLEPLKGLKIDLTANRNFSKNSTEFFKFDNTSQGFKSFSPQENGTFSMSYLTYSTAFFSDLEDHSSQVFADFTNNREKISNRLADQKGVNRPLASNPQYKDGFGPTQQDVIILSFLSAYSGTNPNLLSLNTMPSIPKPNWRVTYDGLSKIDWVQKYVSAVNLSNSYKSTFNVNNFVTDLNYRADGSAKDKLGNYISENTISQLTISEQFAPLFGIDMTWKNSMLTKFEIKKDRTLSMNLSNIQLTENKGSEIVFGWGYRLKQFTVPFKVFGKSRKLNNDVNFKADFSIRKNVTVIRKMVEQTNQATAGMNVMSINISADYVVNEKFNVRLFFDKVINTPQVSTTFPNSNLNAGISVRFTLAP